MWVLLYYTTKYIILSILNKHRYAGELFCLKQKLPEIFGQFLFLGQRVNLLTKKIINYIIIMVK